MSKNIIPTGIQNIFLVESSDKYNWHMVEVTDWDAAVCSCIRCSQYRKPCSHRDEVLKRYGYCPSQSLWEEITLKRVWVPVEAGFQAVQDQVETLATLEAVAELFAA